MAIQSINPATGEILESFDEFTEEQVEAKLKLAKETFRSYRKTSFKTRAAMLFRAADILDTRKDHAQRLTSKRSCWKRVFPEVLSKRC
jgi:succinate-semialdehyde dehydrogenase/glutarate-semialdehyde dehydrogenase